MKQVIWEQEFKVNTLLVNPQKRLGLVGLLNVLQDLAWEHANHLGFGYQDLLDRGVYWVLTRQRLRMDAWPAWGATLSIKTWSRPFSGFMAQRDFEVYQGSCCTDWLNLDLATHRPRRLRVEDSTGLVRLDKALDYEPAKIDAQAAWETLASFKVRNSDHDMQGHVNNTRYAQWVLDALPMEQLAGSAIREYEAGFLAETRLGDELQVQAAQAVPMEGDLLTRRFQGLRQADGKAAFIARLTMGQAQGGA